ncbi:hypothetical protein I316_05889 [Kwoniella heveanensis BCC8398]|uniref:RING-CH-type domain-containing protein n=1 Tax=Kwoniella heveanensis BCC8398 TaxID=1296120 RepID=A0A1B9GN38_9TREE|nr:hypothetical protein I316_05889 [Kwoniella heveanensis BCC8398]
MEEQERPPRPLFSSPATGWAAGPPLHINTNTNAENSSWNADWEEEQHVEASLPSTPLAHDYDQPSITKYESVEHDPPFRYQNLEYPARTRSGPGNSAERSSIAEEQSSTLEDEPELSPGARGPQQHHDRQHAASEEEEEEEEEENHREADDVDEGGEKTCRICFTGPDEDGEEITMGRMISPCLCTGSMRYVHGTLVSGLATSRPILILSTGITFLSITLTVGQILHSMLNKSPAIHRSLLRNYDLRWSPPSILDVITGRDNDVFDGGGNVMIVGGGGTLAFDVFVASIKTFFELSRSFSNSQDRLSEILSLPYPMASFVLGLVIRFMLGIAVMGSMSFLSLLLSLSLFGPLQLANGLRGAGFLGNFGGVRRRIRADTTAGGGGRGPSIGTIMIVGMVLIGAINSLVQVYGGVQSLTGRLLKYVETQILEVNPQELQKEKLRREKERGERARRWWVRWLVQKRWKNAMGWKEVYVRARFRLISLIEGIKGAVRRLAVGGRGGEGGEEE